MKNLILVCFTIVFFIVSATGQDALESKTDTKMSWELANGKIKKIPNYQPQIIFPKSSNKQTDRLDPSQVRLEKAMKERLETSSNKNNFSPTTKNIKQEYPFNIDLYQTDRTTINSSEVLKKNGKPTVLLFGTTFCRPCLAEKEAIRAKYANWQKETDFNLVSISMDPNVFLDKFVNMTEKKNYPWKSYNDNNRAFESVIPNLKGFPITIVFDKDGNITYQKGKYEIGDEDILFEKIKEAACL